MKGEVRVENKGQTITVSVQCWGRDGRRRDPIKRECVDIPTVDVGKKPQSWPTAEAEKEKDRIRQWVREQLNTYIDQCRKAQPNQ